MSLPLHQQLTGQVNVAQPGQAVGTLESPILVRKDGYVVIRYVYTQQILN